MQRLRFIAAVSDSTSKLLFDTFWNCLPRAVNERYIYSSSAYGSPFDVIEHLAALPVSELMNTLVVLEVPSEEYLPWSVAQIGRESRGGAVSLVLSFPEVYFVFIGRTPSELARDSLVQGKWDSIVATHFVTWSSLFSLLELIQHHIASFRTIFDPSGLRACLKCNLRSVAFEDGRGALFVSEIRDRLVRQAAAADEEEDYAYLHGYCLYKLGYATCLLGSEEEFRHQMAPRSHRWSQLHSPDILVTDWDLAYSDHEDKSPASSDVAPNGTDLATSFDSLETAVLVVSGYAEHEKLAAFVDKGGSNGRGPRAKLAKPHSGIYAVNASIQQLVTNPPHAADPSDTEVGTVLHVTPNASDLFAHSELSSGGAGKLNFFRHSLPYGRALIVNFLLSRASALHRDESAGVRQSILQATLALEAKELLGGLSRSTAYDAIYFQTDAELSAELSWFGINAEAEVDSRIAHLKKQSRLMCEEEKARAVAAMSDSRNAEKSTRDLTHSLEAQEAHFLYRVLDLMRDKYNRSGQIYAGERCHRNIVEFHRQIAKQNSLLARYVGLVTADGTEINRVIYSSLIVMLFFSLCYWVLLAWLPAPCVSISKQISLAVGNGIFSFVGLQPGLDEYKDFVKEAHPSGWWRIANFLVALCELLMAYLNLGLLLSVVYRKLTRAGV
jgi:hypothetical protein